MRIYTVQSGDSIFKIARETGTTPARIIIDNELINPSRLSVGESLLITEPEEEYTVKAGDTLEGLARQYGISLMELWQNNPSLGGEDKLYVGEKLVIRRRCPRGRPITVGGYAYPYIDLDTLRKTLPYLSELLVFSYGLRPDGTLIPPEGQVEPMIALAHEYGVRPLLVLTSLTESGVFSDVLAGEVLRNRALWETIGGELLKTAEEKGYGGFSIDFEYIPKDLAEAYAEFVAYLRSLAAPYGYKVEVAVAPKTSSDQPGLLYEGHDYRLLGEAADEVLVMTYEWGYTYGPPMPVAPVNEVKRVLDYAVQEIPPEKLKMGLPNYAYDWPLPYRKGATRARVLSNLDARQLALDKRAAIHYDETREAPSFTYYDKQPSEGPVEHEVWFDDARSLAAKLALIDEYRLAGVSVWNIMRFFPPLWEILSCMYEIKKET